jgi:tRNA threonylcarbamoyladenosine biosynthesis protein TsaE
MISLASVEDSRAFGATLADALEVGDVIALNGDLGAGKTTLARGIISALGFDGDVVSPTFPIVQIYDSPAMRLPLWHVDLYRIEDPSEIDELALDDAREEAALVIEWPERLGTGLWAESLIIRLEVAIGGGRVLTASVPPAWESRWPFR